MYNGLNNLHDDDINLFHATDDFSHKKLQNIFFNVGMIWCYKEIDQAMVMYSRS